MFELINIQTDRLGGCQIGILADLQMAQMDLNLIVGSEPVEKYESKKLALKKFFKIYITDHLFSKAH